MPAGRIVVDSGPLIVWGRLARLDLLRTVCGEVLVPAMVETEVIDDPRRPGAIAILRGFANGQLMRPPVDCEDVTAAPYPTLGVGESASIRLAKSLNCPVLIDEKRGRAIAQHLGLTVIGSLGVMLAAKRRGDIEQIKPVLDKLKKIAYFVSPQLYDAALREAGE